MRKLEIIKKVCVVIKCFCLYRGLFLVKYWVVCFLFYLNKESDVVELKGIYLNW